MRVACVLIPSFAVRLERRDAPVLRETALIVGGAPHQRQVVQDCSPAATRVGVQPGMPLRRAFALCRDARFVEARPLLYAETVEALREVLELIAPRVEVEPAETAAQVCFFLDVAGMERLWPEEEALATDIVMAVRRVCRLTPRVAIADGRATARAAARAAVRKDEGGRIKDECDAVTTSSLILPPSSFRIIPPGAALSFLAALPLDAIALPHGLQAELQLLGIRT